MNTSIKQISVLDTVFSFIENKIESPSNFEDNNYNIVFNNSIGKGEISGIRLKNGIALLQFEATFSDYFTFKANFNNTNILTFGYCSLGGLKYNSEHLKSSATIEHFQTVIFNNSANTNASFTFEKNKTTKMALILIDKEVDFKEYSYDFKSQLFDIFKTKEQTKDFFYVSSYNLKIAEQFTILNTLNAEGIVKKIMTESIVYNILGLELQQHILDKTNAKNNFDGLSKYDHNKIKSISNYIKDDLASQHTINSITTKFGVSALKLQTGFKTLHKATFIEHLKNIRLEKAKQLLKTTDMNVSEAIYTVGFTSRSYFSKIFKARYKCSPSHFKQHLSTDYKMIA